MTTNPEKDIDSISLENIFPGEKTTLFEKAFQVRKVWVNSIASELKKTKLAKLLESILGKQLTEMILKKTLFLELAIPSYTFVRIKYYYSKSQPHVFKPQILIKNKGIYSILQKYIPELDDLLQLDSPNFLKDFLKYTASTFFNLAAFIRLLTTTSSPHKKLGGEITEEFSQGLFRSLFYWYSPNLIAPKNVNLILKNGSIKSTHDNLAKFLQEGGNAYYSRNGFKIDQNLAKYPCIFTPKETSLKFINSDNIWFLSLVLNWLLIFSWWKLYFKKQNIKIWLIEEEAVSTSILQRKAIESLGGFLIARQRSVTYLKDVTMAYLPSHLYFCWNESERAHHIKNLNNTKEVRIVGHIFSPKIQSDSYSLIKEKLRNLGFNKEKFNIIVFDNLSGGNSIISNESQYDFFSAIINWANDKNNVVVYIKPKKHQDFLNRFHHLLRDNQVVKLIDGLDRALPINFSSVMDISIGMNISSAVFEINIAGGRGVHFIKNGYIDHAIAKNQAGFIYRETSLLIQDLNNFHLGKNEKFGLYSGNFTDLDGGKVLSGAESMGNTIRRLFES